jgi:hypothetical protein
MSTPALTRAVADKTLAVVNALYLEGLPAPSRANCRAGKTVLGVASKKLKINSASLAKRLVRAKELFGLAPPWEAPGAKPKPGPKPIDWTPLSPRVEPRAASTRYVLMTSAQDETKIAGAEFAALEAYAKALGAEFFIGGFTYQKGLFEDHSVRTGVFSREVHRYLRPEIIELAPRLIWDGTANILPTASDPLQGREVMFGDRWSIIPHAKIALKSVPVMPGAACKQVMTTGVVTAANYVARNAGQKAKFHHTIGATVAEIAPDGSFFCRQIHVDPDGSFQDLDRVMRGGKIVKAPRVEAITWGDAHFEVMDPGKALASWGWDGESATGGRKPARGAPQSMLDALNPKFQFIHDSFDFTARNSHTRDDPHERKMRQVEGETSIARMFDRVARFLTTTARPDCLTVHVASNHNLQFERWLKDSAAAGDPVNARLWHESNAAWHAALEDRYFQFSPHAHAIRRRLAVDAPVRFLREGESFKICGETHPVECGLHGHNGPNGSRAGHSRRRLCRRDLDPP